VEVVLMERTWIGKVTLTFSSSTSGTCVGSTTLKTSGEFVGGKI